MSKYKVTNESNVKVKLILHSSVLEFLPKEEKIIELSEKDIIVLSRVDELKIERISDDDFKTSINTEEPEENNPPHYENSINTEEPEKVKNPIPDTEEIDEEKANSADFPIHSLFYNMTKSELLDYAKSNNIEVPSELSKRKEIIEFLKSRI
jgi:hypothetical protein